MLAAVDAETRMTMCAVVSLKRQGYHWRVGSGRIHGDTQAGTYEVKPLGEDAEEGAVPETKWAGQPVFAT